MWTRNPVRAKRFFGAPTAYRPPRICSARGYYRDAETGTSRKPRGITAPTPRLCSCGVTRLESPGFIRGRNVKVHSIELLFDRDTEAAIRQIWVDLANADIPSRIP